MFQRIISALVLIGIILTSVAACSSPQPQATYDASKKYAAFLVANSPQSADPLSSAQRNSTNEGMEIGPVVYYEPGTKEFDSYFKKLTPSKQIVLIWVVGSLLDTPNIQKAISAAAYKGQIRYMPVSGSSQQTTP